MKKVIFGFLVVIALLLGSPLSGHAGKTRVFIGANFGVGYPGWCGPPRSWGYYGRWGHPGWGSRFYWRGPAVWGPWYPNYNYPSPPVIIQQQPPVYVQPEQQESQYWYYCQDPQGYYPYVRECPGGWMKVVPEATPPNQ